MAGRLRRRLAGMGTVVLVGGVAGVGCTPGRDADAADERPVDFSATVSYLSKLVDGSDDDNYRFTASTVVRQGDGAPVEGPVVSGVVDGRRAEVRVDIWSSPEAMEADMGGPADGVSYEDQFFEAVIDAHTMFLRAPFLTSALGTGDGGTALDGSLLPGDGSLRVDSASLQTTDAGFYQALAAGWVSVDVQALGDVDPGEAAGRLAGIQNLDPQGFLDLLETGDRVEDLGSREIGGVTLSGLSAQVDYVRALRVQGFDIVDLTSLADAMRGASVPIEVWVDADGMIRRVVLDFNLARLAEVAAATGTAGAADDLLAGGDVRTTTTLDFSDYGDGSNEVELPAAAADMTDTYLSFDGGVPDAGSFLDMSALEGMDADMAALDAEIAAMDAEMAAMDAAAAADMAEGAALDAEISALEEEIANMPPLPEPVPIPPELMEPPPTIPPELMEPPPTVPPELMEPPPMVTPYVPPPTSPPFP